MDEDTRRCADASARRVRKQDRRFPCISVEVGIVAPPFLGEELTSIAKPAAQIAVPTKPINPSGADVMAASAAASVRNTQSPCSVQAIRNRVNEGLMASKRSSTPGCRMRRNRKLPRRSAQIDTKMASRTDRASNLPANKQGADTRTNQELITRRSRRRSVQTLTC